MSLLISLGLIHQLMDVYCLIDGSRPIGLAHSLDSWTSLGQLCLEGDRDGGPALGSRATEARGPGAGALPQV